MEITTEYLKTNWFPILIYGGGITALLAALYLERKDLYCPGIPGKENVHLGAAYAEGAPTEEDDFIDLLAKIRISSRYDLSSVYWRRCIIIAIVLSFLLVLVLSQRLPTPYELLASFILIYLAIYLFLVYYQENLSKPATSQVTLATQYLLNNVQTKEYDSFVSNFNSTETYSNFTSQTSPLPESNINSINPIDNSQMF